MPTDATGTPTALGIPKYNVNVDAPSGLGFNAAMDEIDALIDGRMATPSSPTANDALVYDGADWVGQKIGRSNVEDDLLGAPYFRATRGTNQSINSGADTKVQFSTETFDSDGQYDPATNFRFTPTRAGKYAVRLTLHMQDLADTKRLFIQLFKNGALYSRTLIQASGVAVTGDTHTDLVDMNGSTDYIEAYVQHDHGSARDLFAGENVFSAHWVGV